MKTALLTVLCLLGSAAMADEIRKSTEASAEGFVTVSNTAGTIEIRGWARNRVEVQADLGRGVEELLVERDGNEVRVIVKTPRRRANRSSSDLVVRVPEASSIKVAGVSADVTVDGVFGSQQLQSVSGDVETTADGADIDAQTVSGDLLIEGDGRRMRTAVTTVSGDIELQNLSGDIEASSVSGDVVIVTGDFDHASINTTSGDIVYRAGVRERGRLDVSTINGDVDIKFSGKVSARFDIETFNGEIRNCFGPEAVRRSSHAPGRELAFTEGGGSGRVTIRTLNGDLRLCTG